jgi:NitT/TauT family transport system permease protein
MAGPGVTGVVGEAPPAVTAEASPRSRLGAAALRFLRQQLGVNLLALAVGAVIWQVVALLVDAPWLPTFSAVVSHTVELLGDPALQTALGDSVVDVLLGYAISVVIGGTIGIGMGLSRNVDWALRYYLDLLLFIPPIITAPIFLIIFGLNCKAAVDGVDRSLGEVSRVFGATTRQRVVGVELRAALPLIFTGLYLGVGRAVKGMIIGQLFIAVIGLGAYEARFQQSFDAEGIWSIALLVVVTALVLSWIVQFVDGLVNHWAYGGDS